MEVEPSQGHWPHTEVFSVLCIKKATDFYVLILCLATLLKCLSCRSDKLKNLVTFLELLMYKIISMANEGAFLSMSPRDRLPL